MIFAIERVSDIRRKAPPVPEAVPALIKDFYKNQPGYKDLLYWTIEINSLEELLALYEQVGVAVIIDGFSWSSYEGTPKYCVKIYDGYLE